MERSIVSPFDLISSFMMSLGKGLRLPFGGQALLQFVKLFLEKPGLTVSMKLATIQVFRLLTKGLQYDHRISTSVHK